jgi:hypothetical protein
MSRACSIAQRCDSTLIQECHLSTRFYAQGTRRKSVFKKSRCVVSVAQAQDSELIKERMRDAAGITTATPRVAGQLGQGTTGCRNDVCEREAFRQIAKYLMHG